MKAAIRTQRIIYIISGCILVLLGLIVFRKAVFRAVWLLVISGVFSLLLSPLSHIYETRFSPGVSAALSIGTALLVILIILAAIIVPLINGIQKIISIFPSVIERFFPDTVIMSEISKLISESNALSTLGKHLEAITSSAAGFIGSLADIIIAIVIAWHLLVERTKIALHAELMIPSRFREVVLRHASTLRVELGMYLRGQSIIAVCVGVLSAVGLWLTKIPYALPLGFTAGVLNMIPYLGPVIACVPVGLLALSEGVFQALISVCVLIAVQQIDGLILSPRIVGNSTGFSPVTVMVAIFASGAVWGITGMLAALPALILIRTCVRVFVELGHND